jgi:putative lipoic acid-binding regulatory protein
MNPCPTAWVLCLYSKCNCRLVVDMAKVEFDKENFKEKLEASGEFPQLYMFKFIVPAGKEIEVAALFPKHEITTKASSGGKYLSITAQAMMQSADGIIKIYEEASKIEGLISL